MITSDGLTKELIKAHGWKDERLNLYRLIALEEILPLPVKEHEQQQRNLNLNAHPDDEVLCGGKNAHINNANKNAHLDDEGNSNAEIDKANAVRNATLDDLSFKIGHHLYFDYAAHLHFNEADAYDRVSERNYNLLDIIGGVRQYDYYATLGEKGMTNGICTQEKLANVRLQELKRVGKLFNKTLIVPDPNHLVFHDGQLLEQIDDLTNDILYHMKAIKPTRVFSFPPSGITGHPDHIAMFLAGWRALQTYVQQTDHPIRFYCRVIPTWARGIEGADKYSNLIKHDKLRPTHYVDARPFAHLHLQNLLAHETQQPALSTIFPVLRSPENRGHEFEYYSLVYERR